MANQFYLKDELFQQLIKAYGKSTKPLGVVFTTGTDTGGITNARIFGLEGDSTTYTEIDKSSQQPCPYPPPCG